MAVNRQWRLKARPVGRIKASDFELVEAPVPKAGPGQAVARLRFLSLDPTNRIWVTDAESYLPPVQIGEVMRGGGIAEVVESNTPDYAVGDLVTGLTGWQEYVLLDGSAMVQPLPKGLPVPPEVFMGVLGVTGLTAYFGLLDVGRPQAGETVVVSAAAGATGSVAGQIAKLKGCRAVGIAGGADKCRWLTDELGFDAAVDYKADGWPRRLREACPNGIDVNFENVGGEILDTVLMQMNVFGRIPVCGLISAYNATAVPEGPKNLRAVLTQRLRMQGLIVFDWANRVPEAISQLGQWHKEGKLKIREDVREGGLDAFTDVLNLLYTGGNMGKLVLKV